MLGGTWGKILDFAVNAMGGSAIAATQALIAGDPWYEVLQRAILGAAYDIIPPEQRMLVTIIIIVIILVVASIFTFGAASAAIAPVIAALTAVAVTTVTIVISVVIIACAVLWGAFTIAAYVTENETLWKMEVEFKFKTLLMKIVGPFAKKNYIKRTERDMERFKKFVENL